MICAYPCYLVTLQTNEFRIEYLHRNVDELLHDLLDAFGAVLIEGPKWCGKTTTAEQQANSVIKMQDPDMNEEYLVTAETRPSALLQGPVPRLIDEWQDVPKLWDAVRTTIDNRGEPGQFILTGSNSVRREETQHSGNGRITRLKMLPMSLWESKESSGDISLQRLFDDTVFNIDGIMSPMSINDLIFATCRGGWPSTLKSRTDRAKLFVAQSYLDSVCKDDISRIDRVSRNKKLARLIIRAYSRNISTLAQKKTLLADVTTNDNVSCTRPTFDEYVDALERLFVIQDVEAWCPAIRSKTAIRSNPKRSFCDPSIAVAALGMTPESLSIQLKTFGFLFEQLCIRDLRAYTPGFGNQFSYYHDRYGLEADIVLHLPDGRYALIECKLGSREVEEGARHLLKLKQLIREKNQAETQMPIREPDLLIVLTGGKIAFTREDGVKVIPLATLKP